MSLRFLRRVLSALIGFNPKPGVSLRRRSYRLTLETLEDRLTPSTLTVDTNLADHNYHTIQSAVNAAHAGDTIVVKPGTYTEQVTIAAGKDNLTLTTADGRPDATIQSPVFSVTSASQIDSAYVIRIRGAHGVTINDFNINGGASTNTEYGIKVDGGASASITNNKITNIIGTLGVSGGGAGIAVGENTANTSGQAIVVNNTVSGYGKVGIVIDGTGSFGTVANNYVKGLGSGATAFLSQNGIQVSFGANANVSGNSVTANTVVAQSAAGILVDQAGSSTTIEDNWTYANEYGIFVFLSNHVTIANNFSLYNHNDGIQLQGANNSTVTRNISADNDGDGISVYGSVNNDPTSAASNVVSYNVIFKNVGNGVTVQDTTGTQVVANILVGNHGNGVSLSDALDGSVMFNFIDQDNGSDAFAKSSNSTTRLTNNLIVS